MCARRGYWFQNNNWELRRGSGVNNLVCPSENDCVIMVSCLETAYFIRFLNTLFNHFKACPWLKSNDMIIPVPQGNYQIAKSCYGDPGL